MEYDQTDYSQLPDLLDMEAIISPDDGNVTLFVNGTNRSNDVTVMCGHLRNAVRNQIETIFTLVLEYVSKFSCLNCIVIIVYQKIQVLYHLQIMYITQSKVQVEGYRSCGNHQLCLPLRMSALTLESLIMWFTSSQRMQWSSVLRLQRPHSAPSWIMYLANFHFMWQQWIQLG